MSQRSSVPQAASFVSVVLKRDNKRSPDAAADNIVFTLLHAACRAVGCPDRFGQERPALERTAWEE